VKYCFEGKKAKQKKSKTKQTNKQNEKAMGED